MNEAKYPWLVVASFVAILLYMYFSSPREVVVKQTGEIVGVMNSAREYLQGEMFWRNQLSVVDEAIKAEMEWQPNSWAENLRAIESMLNKSTEEFFRENPDLRPSVPKTKADALRQRAEALREEADRVQRAEWVVKQDQMEERWHIERLEALGRVRAIIQEKLDNGI